MKPPGTDAHLAGAGRTGVLVLSGSSGRVERQRCDVLAAGLDVTALSYRWFDLVLDRVPLESFEEPLAWLHERCDRLVVLGTSRGAEAALLLGSLHAEVDAVVAVSPSHVVWAALSDRRPQTSSWTRGGEPLPFVPYDDDWVPPTDPPEYVGQYHSALARFADRVPAARIPVERIAGEVVLSSGGDDRLWPAGAYADEIARRRAAYGLDTVALHEPAAGHRVLLPGETPQPARLVHGGTPAADAALGTRLWSELVRLTGR
ncbi:acyl-CoA thioester hydrolase/BAAT C-terminal domain-containing protein [Nocardioides flavescens]|uniref:Acyl-CoA thioesterase n=1 Tax=Nocardioides flavescens TaxID=2691959 RepID=A0A6L7EL40_9ACTN|nr:acyl-CoA thioester hydrolase/BAAT C-terminal domain-containing protein [Nocardioides flavescens]MXG87993.1 acyl-CoA thioesterase [Nocardioides flavescens]